MAIKETKFELTLGYLIRKRVINEIRKSCDLHNIDCQISEYSNWLSTDYIIRLKGEEVWVNALLQVISNMSS